MQEIDISKKLRHETSPITSLSIYRDMSGIIRFCSATNMPQQTTSTNLQVPEQEDFEDVDDLLLYGDSKKLSMSLSSLIYNFDLSFFKLIPQFRSSLKQKHRNN